MRIDPTGLPTTTLRPAGTPGSRSADKAGQAQNPGEAEAFVATEELTRLLAAVAEQPDVRPEAVQAASERLQSGDLLTPAAAAEVAKEMLGSAE